MKPETAAALQWLSEIAEDEDLRFIAAKAAAMVEVYLEVNPVMSLQIEAQEEWYELDVINPRTGRLRQQNFTHCGFFDGVCSGTFAGRTGRFILERKTCDQDITDGSPYWDRLLLNHQVDEYALAYWQKHGQQIEGVIYDVLRQPGISPRKITLGELAEIAENGIYFGRRVNNDSRMLAAAYLGERERHQADKKASKKTGEYIGEAPEQPTENPNLFRLRCLDVLNSRASEYYRQKFVYRGEKELLEYADELWTITDLIRACGSLERSPRNPGACFGYNSTCEYIKLCTGTSAEDANCWEQKETNPFRLSQSRIATFQTCRRKHYFRHVAGIVPLVRSTTERQTLGSLVHKALEKAWQSQQQLQNS